MRKYISLIVLMAFSLSGVEAKKDSFYKRFTNIADKGLSENRKESHISQPKINENVQLFFSEQQAVDKDKRHALTEFTANIEDIYKVVAVKHNWEKVEPKVESLIKKYEALTAFSYENQNLEVLVRKSNKKISEVVLYIEISISDLFSVINIPLTIELESMIGFVNIVFKKAMTEAELMEAIELFLESESFGDTLFSGLHAESIDLRIQNMETVSNSMSDHFGKAFNKWTITHDEANRSYGVLSLEGDTILPFEYDEISYLEINLTNPESNSFYFRPIGFLVAKEGKRGLTSIYGHWFYEPEYDEIAPFVYDDEVNYVLLYQEGKVGLSELKDHSITIPIIYKDIKEGDEGCIFLESFDGSIIKHKL